MENLLEDLTLVREKYEKLEIKKEKFNLFKILHKCRDERRVHSRFIASLLDVKGSHNKGDLFLDKFMLLVQEELKDVEPLFNNYDNLEIYPTEEDKKEKDCIDIFIIDRKCKKALIIENKIDAPDSNRKGKGKLKGQLETYFNKVKDKYKIPERDIRTVYLSLDGHEPGKESLGKYDKLENINGCCLSYENNILAWLEACQEEVNSPYLTDALMQYKKIIEEMTHSEASIEQRKRIKDVIGKSSESVKSAKMLVDNFVHVKWHTIDDFWNELQKAILNRGYKLLKDNDDYTDYVKAENITKISQCKNTDCGVYFSVGKIVFSIFNSGCFDLYWEIENEDSLSEKLVAKINNVKENGENRYKSDSDGELMSVYFFDDFEQRIQLNDFTRESTFRLIESKFRGEMVTRMLDEIDEFLESIK